MPRNMSFFLTKEQILNRSKTVTRRLGWDSLKVGDIVWAVEKGMGLKKGEKVKRLTKIRIVDIGKVMLGNIDQDECIKEGFPLMLPEEFVDMFCSHNKGCLPCTSVNRIEFEYVGDSENKGFRMSRFEDVAQRIPGHPKPEIPLGLVVELVKDNPFITFNPLVESLDFEFSDNHGRHYHIEKTVDIVKLIRRLIKICSDIAHYEGSLERKIQTGIG